LLLSVKIVDLLAGSGTRFVRPVYFFVTIMKYGINRTSRN